MTSELQTPKCSNCGGSLVFDPSSQALRCSQCKTSAAFPSLPEGVALPTLAELDYMTWTSNALSDVVALEVRSLRCGSCGATTTLPPNQTSGKCPFCRTPFVAEAVSQRAIRPQGVIPFALDQTAAGQSFSKWVGKRWLAPRNLALSASGGKLTGIYVPWWTFDAHTTSDYEGTRGVDRTVTESHSVRDAEGNSHQESTTRIETDWYPASGTVQVPFDDLLVFAGGGVPAQRATELDPWPWDLLVPFRDELLLGFVSESYRVDLPAGFEAAGRQMEPRIRDEVESDIGGDHQRIKSLDTTYDAVTFKHLLLPVWLNVYQHKGKTFQVLVNGATGEVRGERPYSPLKILALVVAILVTILLVVLLTR